MWRNKILLGTLCLLVLLIAVPSSKAKNVIFSENFESGIPADWAIDNGVWELCLYATSPPFDGGIFAVGTVCNGNYPRYTDSRLISPAFRLDAVTGDEELYLRFWLWFNYQGGDYGYIQISVQDEDTNEWSSWVDIGSTGQWVSNWGLKAIDLTAYAEKMVRIAFYHSDNDDGYQGPGWFIDNIEVIKKVPVFTGDFECGWGDWSTDYCVWEVGITGIPYSGSQCAGTVFGNYPRYTDSRLISPTFRLGIVTGNENPSLRFAHWYNYSSGDHGYVQISVYDEATGIWSDWNNLAGPITGFSAAWTLHPPIDLTAYAGKKVRIAFYHSDNDDGHQGPGWFIDHVRITGFAHFCECDLNQDGRCDMQDWLLFGQDWGRTDCSSSAPCDCDLNHDANCDMLDWLRFGEDWGNTDCLTCQ